MGFDSSDSLIIKNIKIMAKYIDKSALVAEIESKIEKYTKRGEESDAKRDGYGMYWGGVLSCLNEIWTLCDTLEVKEVDLEYNGKAMLHVLTKGVEQGKREILDKACEWLKKNRKNYSLNALGEKYLIDDFKKAMKGE